ncbi:carboxypeptidase-like regulatory domain-containing protein [Granulicella sp. L60]|uniref:carboxypeptidase-like regulatory domain-containing protein n=1 Tax=Granulicella sp. L60 TaxID=1641866 RepID=UPI00131CD6BE|nr:TonB-dependent receptor [Granulicella sp. L60]
MTNILSKIALLATVLCLCVGPMLAQSSTQGAIGGTVFDTTDAIVSKATVTIHNNGTNAEITLTADDSGYFKAPLLEPGTYTVTVSAGGFSQYKAENVIVQVGQLSTVAPRLAAGGAAQIVEVTADTPILNFESPDLSSVLNKSALDNLPVNNRRWSSLAMTTPGVVSDSNGFGLVSIRGISPILNNIEIDGADDNQAYYAEERGRTREAYSTSENAVREFAVNSGVYAAEYGRAAGGVINSVTRSGTNQLHGELYFYDRQSNWAAFNDFSTITTPVFANGATIPTSFLTTPLKPKDLRKIYGFTVGGALIKDKLFWIYTYDQHSRIFPGSAVPNKPSAFFAQPDTTLASIVGNPTCNLANGFLSGSASTNSNYTLDSQTCTLAARQGISYAAAASAYTNGILGLLSDLGTVPRAGYQEINTPKIDYQITPKEHVSVLYHRLRWDSPGGVQTTPTDNYAVDTWGNDFVKLDYGVTKLTSLIKSNISNELLYQYGRELNDESQQPYSAYTLGNLVGAGGNVPEIALATSSAFFLGSPYYSYRKALPDERKWQIGDTLYYSKGNHSFKFGVDTVHNNDLINNTYESNGYITYGYVSNYINDLLNSKDGKGNTCNSSALSAATSSATGVGAFPCYSSFVQGFGSPVFAINTFDYGVFAQDNWKLTPRLTLQLGVRYDYEALPSTVANLTSATANFTPYPGLTNNPSDKNNVGPRLGFSYDLYGTGKTVLRGGYGMYYGRITNGVLLNVLLDTGSPNGQYTTTYKPNAAGAPQFPNIVGSTGAAPTPSSYYLASNLQNPMVHEFDLQIQQDLGRNTVFQVYYMGALGRELPNFLDLNLNPVTTPVTITAIDPSNKGPLRNGASFIVPTYSSYGNTALFGAVATKYQAITEVTSNINSSYHAVVFEIKNNTFRSIQFDANYTWSHALDYAQNATTTVSGNNWYDPYGNPRANYGNSAYNVPNRFVGYALYSFPNLSRDSWLKYLINDWKLDNSFQMQNGLPYTETVSGFAGNAVLSDWNGASGSTYIPQVGRNTFQYPRKIVDDLRLEKQFAITERYRLQLIANAFNIANHQNVDGISTTGYQLQSTGTTTGTATYQYGQTGTTAFGAVTSSNNSGFLYTPRQLELAAKFSF